MAGLTDKTVAETLQTVLTGLLVAKDADDQEEVDTSCLDALEVFPKRCTVRSFAEAGVLTENAGFVIRTRSGKEFQVTVVG
jgi:hypothetical protein